MNFLFEGKQITKEEAGKHPIIAAGDWNKTKAVWTFKSSDDFNNWVKAETELFEEVTKINTLVAQAKQLEKKTSKYTMNRQLLLQERIRDDLKGLAEEYGLKPDSKELFVRASAEYNVLEGPIFHSTLLFNGPNWGGKFMVLPGGIPIPDFGTFNFDNKATTANVGVVATLWENPWFTGRTAWLACFPPWATNFDLLDLNFQNMASSGVST